MIAIAYQLKRLFVVNYLLPKINRLNPQQCPVDTYYARLSLC